VGEGNKANYIPIFFWGDNCSEEVVEASLLVHNEDSDSFGGVILELSGRSIQIL